MDEPDIYIQLYITITEILILQKCHSTITMQETQINLMTEEKTPFAKLKGENEKNLCWRDPWNLRYVHRVYYFVLPLWSLDQSDGLQGRAWN